MKNKSSWLVTATCLALPLAAAAQANSADPGSPAPALRYDSAFADYKPWQEIQPGDWRAINDALGKGAAGHGEHGAAPAVGTPAAAPAPAQPTDSRPAPVPGQDAHHRHGGQK